MKTLVFYGYSDDTFGEYGFTNEDVDNCGSGNPIHIKLVSSEGAMVITGQYSRFDNGCWDIAVGQVDEDIPIPAWSMEFGTAEDGYSTLLRLTVPDDTRMSWYNDTEFVGERGL